MAPSRATAADSSERRTCWRSRPDSWSWRAPDLFGPAAGQPPGPAVRCGRGGWTSMRRAGLLLTLTGVLALVLTPSAHAFIYWASSQDAKLGRASNDGTSVDKHFISTGALPFAVAVKSGH